MNVKIDPWGSVNSKNILILISFAGCVLLIACMNFIILAIGRSAGRSKEVGVRKIIGSRRKQLAFQFLAESFLLTIFSAVLGVGIAQTLLPLFNELSGGSLVFSFSAYPEMIILLLGTVLFAGLLAGSYPALVLSGLKPVEVLKNTVKISGSNFFTKSLVTFQFVLSVTLIIATIIILEQLSFMRSKDLGFQKENVVMIPSQGTDTEKIYPLLKEKLLVHTAVTGVSASAVGLGAGEGQMGRAYDFNNKRQGVIEYPVDHDFLKVLEISLVAGRNFDRDIASDTVTSIIVNESLVKNALNTTPEKALGMSLQNSDGDQVARIIIGVVKDFHYEDLTRLVRPQLFFQPSVFKPNNFFVRINSGDPANTLAMLQTTWKSIVPELPFQYSFLDQKFADFYKAEERWSNIIGLAGNICIFLAGLGLFGLASLAIANRTKEIGIRKVLGASLINVVSLLCSDFVKLVIIAIVIASPIAWYAMNQWLQDFAYKIEIKWWMFVVTGVLAITMALLTVSIQAIKAALTNPVKSLKSE
jgi:putative ABC transport system permease protein